MGIRRLVGGYAWRDELEAMRSRTDKIQRGLLALSKRTSSKEVADEIVAMLALNYENAIGAMELADYQKGEGTSDERNSRPATDALRPAAYPAGQG